MLEKIGKLFIVATPIGNLEDITLRALRILQEADIIVCEEIRQGKKLLNQLKINNENLFSINEHNESEIASEFLQYFFNGKNVALFSDCGTPVFSDPGHFLIKAASEAGVQVVPVPGTSSLMAALSVLDFKLGNYIFGGFLPRSNDERLLELRRLNSYHMPVILMDTPYRLGKLLSEVSKVFGKGQQITLTCDLTLPTETIFRGTVNEVINQVNNKKFEFILIIHGSKKLQHH